MKRSAADLEAEDEESEDIEGIEYSGKDPILNEAELEEIQRELADLEDDSEDGSVDSSTDTVNDGNTEESNLDYQDAELSDGDFSDLLNYSSDGDGNE